MQDTPIKRKKRNKKTGFRYFVLFALVFFLALFGLSYLVKSYSPDVDVSIGNNENLTLNDSDSDIKTVDERLKWIQMEDELPSVSIRTGKDKDALFKEGLIKDERLEKPKEMKPEEKKMLPEKSKDTSQKLPIEALKPQIKELPKPKIEEKHKEKTEIEPVITKPIPLSKPSKVYVGKYSNVEEAVKIQNKISTEERDVIPFIKSVNGYYVVQVGSFSDKDKALSLTSRLNSKGYPVRTVSE